MKKRLLSMILAISMVLTFLPVSAITAFADDGDENIVASGTCGAEGDDGDNLTWELNQDGTLTISGKGEMEEFDCIDDGVYDVPWLTYRDDIKQVIINTGVTSISGYAFAYYKNLNNIKFADTVKNISDCAFSDNPNLTSVILPEKMESISGAAFAGCSKLESIVIPDGVESVEISMFNGCTSLDNVMIPKSVKYIERFVFNDCTNLKTILYAGTATDWKNIGIDTEANGVLKNVDVKCAHTVTFKNGETEIGTETVPYDKTVTAPDESKITAPEGQYLTGWYTDAEKRTDEFKLDLKKNTITEDLTLYAGFDYPTLTVTNGTFTCTVDGKEVTESPAKIPVGTSVTVTFDKDAFADSSLKFSYWNIEGLTNDEANKYNKQESFTFTMPAAGVTLEAMTQDATIDDPVAEVLGTTAMVTTAVAGTAVLAYTGYQLGSELYLIYLLPTGAEIPTNTAQLAKLVWTDAGKPAPAALLAEDATEEQQAMAWAVENDLIDADKAADDSVSRIEVIKTWKKAQSVKKG